MAIRTNTESDVTGSFDAGALARKFSDIDECPSSLLDLVVTSSIGTLEERLAATLMWRQVLLDGELPTATAWPEARVAEPIVAALAALDLPRYCRGQGDLVDALLRDVLIALARQDEMYSSEIARRLEELTRLERIRQAPVAGKADEQVILTDDYMRVLKEKASVEFASQRRGPDDGILSVWRERVRLWSEISEVFGDLGQLMGRGWDLSLGVLRTVGWLEIVRLAELVKSLPQVKEIVETLGRLQVADDGEPISEKIFHDVRRIEVERLEVVTPLVPGETRGVERSDELTRMLPAEAAMLGHPKLRLLWHARRAERSLLTYRVEGVDVELVEREVEDAVEGVDERRRQKRGPIVVIIDTSGSMSGLPETVAKATVLEAVRIAHSELRQCLLYAFSGPSQVLEHELDLSADGLRRLSGFLTQSFGGGTNPGSVLSRIAPRLKDAAWSKADVLIVSDGEWPTPSPAILQGVDEVRRAKTRFHGVQIGNRGRTGLHEVCDPVHVFEDWAALGGWRMR